MNIFIWLPLVIVIWYLIVKRGDIACFTARIDFNKGNPDLALKKLEKAEKTGKINISNKMLLGYLYLRNGKLDKARTTLAEASMMPGKMPVKNRIKAMRALVMWKEGYIKDAIESLENLIADFKNTTVYQDLGLLYILDKDKEKALSFNLEAYDYNSDDMIIMDNLAEAYVLCGMNDEAEKMYEKLLEMEPHFPEAYYGYGKLLCEKGEKEKGIEYMEKALDKRFSFLSVMQKDEVLQLIERYKG